MAKSAEEKRQYDIERRKRVKQATNKIPEQLLNLVSFIKPGINPEKVALCYAKTTRNDGFSVKGLMNLNPTMFNNETKTRRVIVLLRNNGMVHQLGNGRYAITTRGEQALFALTRRDKSKPVENDGDDW